MNKRLTIKKLINEQFNNEIEGADIYHHDGSMWIIFTEQRRWVIEFTKTKTLWYNYKHFDDIFRLFGMTCTEESDRIKEWFEDKFIFNEGIKEIDDSKLDRPFFVEDVIDNGVKDIDKSHSNYRLCVDNTIQNGVKNTQSFDGEALKLVDKIIDDGVKHTEWNGSDLPTDKVEETIQNGVKCVMDSKWTDFNQINDTIQNGVNETKLGESLKLYVDETIDKGVKEMYSLSEDLEQEIDYAIYEGVKNTLSAEYNEDLDEAIKKGVKYMMSGSEFKNNQVEDIIKYSDKL